MGEAAIWLVLGCCILHVNRIMQMYKWVCVFCTRGTKPVGITRTFIMNTQLLILDNAEILTLRQDEAYN